jgi:hypothetical protein
MTVVQKPEISVTPTMIGRACIPYVAPSEVNRASYKPVAMAAPMITQASKNTGSDGAAAISNRPAARIGPWAPSTRRPPRRAISRPQSGDSRLATSRPIEAAPSTHWCDQPVSAAIGSASTPSR